MTTPGGQWNDLSMRLLSGGIAAVVGLYAMWLGGIAFHLLVALVAGLLVWEVARMIGGARLAMPLGGLTSAVLLLLAQLPPAYALPLVFAPALVGIARLERRRVTYGLYTSAILFAAFGLIVVRDDFGFVWMAWLALCVIASDILGYFAGRLIGGPKFWPRVSPKKTWSGTVAGWVGAALVGAVFMLQGYASAQVIPISIAIAIAGQMGDVAESALKRRMGVKDSSAMIPGHGGMFDRFDSMLGASLFLLFVGQIVDFPPGVN